MVVTVAPAGISSGWSPSLHGTPDAVRGYGCVDIALGRKLPASTTQAELLALIEKKNADPKIPSIFSFKLLNIAA